MRRQRQVTNPKLIVKNPRKRPAERPLEDPRPLQRVGGGTGFNKLPKDIIGKIFLYLGTEIYMVPSVCKCFYDIVKRIEYQELQHKVEQFFLKYPRVLLPSVVDSASDSRSGEQPAVFPASREQCADYNSLTLRLINAILAKNVIEVRKALWAVLAHGPRKMVIRNGAKPARMNCIEQVVASYMLDLNGWVQNEKILKALQAFLVVSGKLTSKDTLEHALIGKLFDFSKEERNYEGSNIFLPVNEACKQVQETAKKDVQDIYTSLKHKVTPDKWETIIKPLIESQNPQVDSPNPMLSKVFKAWKSKGFSNFPELLLSLEKLINAEFAPCTLESLLEVSSSRLIDISIENRALFPLNVIEESDRLKIFHRLALLADNFTNISSRVLVGAIRVINPTQLGINPNRLGMHPVRLERLVRRYTRLSLLLDVLGISNDKHLTLMKHYSKQFNLQDECDLGSTSTFPAIDCRLIIKQKRHLTTALKNLEFCKSAKRATELQDEDYEAIVMEAILGSVFQPQASTLLDHINQQGQLTGAAKEFLNLMVQSFHGKYWGQRLADAVRLIRFMDGSVENVNAAFNKYVVDMFESSSPKSKRKGLDIIMQLCTNYGELCYLASFTTTRPTVLNRALRLRWFSSSHRSHPAYDMLEKFLPGKDLDLWVKSIFREYGIPLKTQLSELVKRIIVISDCTLDRTLAELWFYFKSLGISGLGDDEREEDGNSESDREVFYGEALRTLSAWPQESLERVALGLLCYRQSCYHYSIHFPLSPHQLYIRSRLTLSLGDDQSRGFFLYLQSIFPTLNIYEDFLRILANQCVVFYDAASGLDAGFSRFIEAQLHNLHGLIQKKGIEFVEQLFENQFFMLVNTITIMISPNTSSPYTGSARILSEAVTATADETVAQLIARCIVTAPSLKAVGHNEYNSQRLLKWLEKIIISVQKESSSQSFSGTNVYGINDLFTFITQNRLGASIFLDQAGLKFDFIGTIVTLDLGQLATLKLHRHEVRDDVVSPKEKQYFERLFVSRIFHLKKPRLHGEMMEGLYRAGLTCVAQGSTPGPMHEDSEEGGVVAEVRPESSLRPS